MPTATAGDGVRLNYEVTGSGPALVLCHGLGGNLTMFAAPVERLKGEYTVVTWDNRGCGESEARGPYSLRRFSDDLLAVLAAAGIDRAIVAGVSWGGIVAQRFTLDHPAMVRALLVDSSSSEVNERAAEGWLARGRAYFDAPRDVPTIEAGTGRPADPDAHMAQCEAIAALQATPMTPELERIGCPALCIAGESDEIAGVGGTVIMSRKIAGAKLVIVPSCGHGVVLGAPAVFDAELRELASRAP